MAAIEKMNKEIREDKANTKVESKQSMDSLAAGIRQLTINQAAMDNTIGTMKSEQGELSKTVAAMQVKLDSVQMELDETKKVVDEHKYVTATSVDVIADN